MKVSLIITLLTASINSFAGTAALKCWIQSENVQAPQNKSETILHLTTEEDIETKIGNLYGDQYFVKINGQLVTIIAKNSSGETYASTGSINGAENGGLADSCAGTAWYGDCLLQRKKIGAVGCSLIK